MHMWLLGNMYIMVKHFPLAKSLKKIINVLRLNPSTIPKRKYRKIAIQQEFLS